MWYVEYNLKNRASKKGEGIRGKKTPNRQQYGNYQREKWREVKEGKGGINGNEMKLDLG